MRLRGSLFCMARYSIAGIHLEMYHSLLQINFGTMFPEDQAMIERGDPDTISATIADDWKVSVNPSEWRHGIESLQLNATNGLVNYCILYRRRPLPYRFQL